QEEKTVPIEDIGFVVIENQQIYISIPAITELTKNNVSVIFCDEKHMPLSMNLPLECNSIQNQLFSVQIESTLPTKKNCWKQIIEQKINNQALVLEKYGHNSEYLKNISKEVKSDDSTNREGFAAKIYWNSLFGKNWSRDRFGEYPNNYLNYGYAILRAGMARAIVGSGLLPTLGIHHHNKYDAYALADDLMEPYRPFVDDMVIEYIESNPEKIEIEQDFKSFIYSLMTRDTFMDKKKHPFMIALTFTSSSLSKVFLGKTKKLALPEFM
ncbi:MAG: type II CRISPR-associated endonuclease Cas1, partial [Treponema sp.]|nr:type II CRISPR-associated endonuclease Cas1 [Treponema sp.]